MKNRKMPKGGRNLEKVLVVINYCSYVEFLEVAYRQKQTQDLVLVLFIFNVGFQVGPSFFASFRKGGLQLNLLAVAIVALGVVTTVMISKLSGETLDVMAGVYSGAISSTPGMSAAQQAVSSTGIGSADVIANSYAVTYPIGVVGPIICCILIRSICKVRLEQEPVNLVEPVESAPLNTVGNQENAVGKSLMVVFVGMCLEWCCLVYEVSFVCSLLITI